MSSYIQDYNNAESITNDVTVLNTTNYGNLTYKVDELQFVLNELHKYKHTTIISTIKDAWADKSWLNTDGGTTSDDNTNYILNGESQKCTGDAEDDGIHVEKTLDLTTHADGYTAGADDLITFFCYISSADLANLTAGGHTCQLEIGFYNDILSTVTNYYWARFDDQLKAGKNIVKLKKSDFSSVGSPDWSTIRGLDVYLYNDDPNAEISFSIDMILLHGQDFKSFVYKTTNEVISSSTTLQNDDELFVTLPQNGIFEVNLNAVANCASSAPDIQCDWTVTGDITLMDNGRFCQSQGTGDTNSTNSDAIKIIVYDSLGEDVPYGMDGTRYTYVKEKLLLQTGNDGGVLQFRWAQYVSNASGTAVKPGSYLHIIQLQ